MATRVHNVFRALSVLTFLVFFIRAAFDPNGEFFFLALFVIGLPVGLILAGIDAGIEYLIKRSKNKRSKNKRFTEFRQRVYDPASYSRE